MKTAEQMCDLTKGHFGPMVALLCLEKFLALSLTFTLETKTSQMFCWHPQKTNQTAVHILRPRKSSKTATASQSLSGSLSQRIKM